jgi:hypothetical protein
MLPNTDPIVDYTIKELLRWVAENVITLVVVTNVLTYLKILAIRNNRVKDDKILTWLIGFFTFKWLKNITTPIAVPGATKETAIPLTEVVEDEKVGDGKNIEELTKEQREWMDIRLKEIEKAAGIKPEVKS